jgi:HEAT repeat protein
MLFFACALVLSIASTPQAGTPPDTQRVKAAVVELEKAFKEGQPSERTKAIQNNQKVVDAEVIHWIARGLQDRDVEVQDAAIEALRHMDHPDALKELQAAAQRDGPMRKDPKLYAALLKAIGQHGSPTSIPLFKEGLWAVQDRAVIQARVLGLGRIRTTAAVEALIGLMRTAGKGVIQPFMEDFRLALAELTGVDQGRSQELWFKWWNENHGKIKVDAEPPELEKPLQKRWDSYWGTEPHEGKQKKQGERGRDDSETGKGKQ